MYVSRKGPKNSTFFQLMTTFYNFALKMEACARNASSVIVHVWFIYLFLDEVI